MCTAITFPVDLAPRQELAHFLTDQELSLKRQGDLLKVSLWDERPYLPAYQEEEVHLWSWGNLLNTVNLPKGGFAKIESIRDGYWDSLSPQKVIIPSRFVLVGKRWLRTPLGVMGIKVRKNNIIRVYIVTAKAERRFLELLGQERQVIGKIIY